MKQRTLAETKRRLGLGYLVMFVLSTLAEQRILRALPPVLATDS